MIDGRKKISNIIVEEYETSGRWNKMMINSVHKKGEKEDLNNKRGLTNILSKVFEKTVDGVKNIQYDKNQNGGRKRRGTVDNWMMIRGGD